MVVVDGRTARGHPKENNLPFEGFLEALCRMCMLKALPTDEELKFCGCPDAGVFLQRLHAGNLPEEFTDGFNSDAAGFADEATAFLNDRAANWGEDSVHTLDVAMRHMMACIVRTVEEDTVGTDNMQLTLSEVKNWAEHHLRR